MVSARLLYVLLSPLPFLFNDAFFFSQLLTFAECPVYRKPRRTDLEYITMLDLRSPVAPEKWTLRGVALLCDTK